jgi:hypothetical protein
VDCHRVFIAVKLVAPNLIEQLLPRENLPRIAQQKPEQIKLLGSQRDSAAVDADRAATRIEG